MSRFRTLLSVTAVSLGLCLGLPAARAEPKDAEVTIVGNTITVKTEIILYGKGATHERVREIRENILANWEFRGDGKPWTYTHPHSGAIYTVRFEVLVSLYGNRERQNPSFILDSWNPVSRKNYIRASGTPVRSHVSGGDEGRWYPSSPNTYAHEFGHLLGLDDRYYESGGAQPGWEYNIMATSWDGRVEQKNIDAVVRRILRPFKTPPKFRYRDEINITIPNG